MISVFFGARFHLGNGAFDVSFEFFGIFLGDARGQVKGDSVEQSFVTRVNVSFFELVFVHGEEYGDFFMQRKVYLRFFDFLFVLPFSDRAEESLGALGGGGMEWKYGKIEGDMFRHDDKFIIFEGLLRLMHGV